MNQREQVAVDSLVLTVLGVTAGSCRQPSAYCIGSDSR
jgi:hypothetical protein